MKDARDLFIDIRIELRKLQRDFHKTELCKRLDETIYRLGRPQRPASAAAPASSTAAVAGDVNAGSEDLALALAWQAAAQQLKETEPAIHAELCRAVMLRMGLPLAQSPGSTQGNDPLDAPELAPSPAAVAAEPAQSLAADADDGELGAGVLARVAAGERSLSAAQREIAVGEAVVLSGFEVNPEQLIAKGDAEIARTLIELRQREPAE